MAKQKHKVETFSRNVLEALEWLDPLPLFCDLGYSLETCKAKEGLPRQETTSP